MHKDCIMLGLCIQKQLQHLATKYCIVRFLVSQNMMHVSLACFFSFYYTGVSLCSFNSSWDSQQLLHLDEDKNLHSYSLTA